jgi:hypothetical protein
MSQHDEDSRFARKWKNIFETLPLKRSSLYSQNCANQRIGQALIGAAIGNIEIASCIGTMFGGDSSSFLRKTNIGKNEINKSKYTI